MSTYSAPHPPHQRRADAAPAGDAPPNAGAPAGEGGDGEIVGGPHNPQQIAAQKRLQQTQAQVDEVSQSGGSLRSKGSFEPREGEGLFFPSSSFAFLEETYFISCLSP